MYIDAAIYVKLLTQEPDSRFYGKIVDETEEIWSSQLLITEVFSALLRKEREGFISQNHRQKVWNQVLEDTKEGRLQLVALDSTLFSKANQILETCHPEIPLRTLDAIHLASFDLIQKGPLLTSDVRMRQAAEKMKFPLHPLPPN